MLSSGVSLPLTTISQACRRVGKRGIRLQEQGCLQGDRIDRCAGRTAIQHDKTYGLRSATRVRSGTRRLHPEHGRSSSRSPVPSRTPSTLGRALLSQCSRGKYVTDSEQYKMHRLAMRRTADALDVLRDDDQSKTLRIWRNSSGARGAPDT